MSDFDLRFGHLFRRYVKWIKSGRVLVERVEGRYPVNDDTGMVTTESSSDEADVWKDGTYTVVTVFYGDDYPVSERERGLGGRISRECASILIGVGLGSILHHVITLPDRWVVWIEEDPQNERQLPPAD